MVKRIVIFLSFFVFLTGVSSASPKSPDVVSGEYLVKVTKEVHGLGVDEISDQLGAQVKRKLSKESQLVVIQQYNAFTTEQAVTNLSSLSFVEYAEPNAIFRIVGSFSGTPNDPKFNKQWGLKNVGQKDSSGTMGEKDIDVNVSKAWEVTTGNRETIVAVIDTGVDYRNDDLKNNIWTNEAEANGTAGVDDDGNGYIDDIHGYDFANNDSDPMDDHGHGTHCAGVIGSEGDNEYGIAGVAWNTRIMALKFLTRDGGGTLEGAIQAIDYSTKMGATISSNSWGCADKACNSRALKESIIRANEGNQIFIAAAGNSNVSNDKHPHYPSSFKTPNMVAVAAINNTGRRASFSNWGIKTVHIGAPGRNILSWTTKGLQSWSGTSMATPFVSGVAALVMAADDTLTNLEVKDRILKTSKKIPSMREKVISGGIVSAYHAVLGTEPPPDPRDPHNWEAVKYKMSSKHPYKPNSDQTFEIEVEGAEEIAIYFNKFQIEAGYDYLEIYDGNGALVEKWTGNHQGEFSPTIIGNKATLHLVSDRTLQEYGFDVTKVAFQ